MLPVECVCDLLGRHMSVRTDPVHAVSLQVSRVRLFLRLGAENHLDSGIVYRLAEELFGREPCKYKVRPGRKSENKRYLDTHNSLEGEKM